MPSPESVRALALVQQLVQRRAGVIDGRVQPDMEDCDLDREDIWGRILEAKPENIRTFGPDESRGFEDKMALLMQLPIYFPNGVYCKVSLRMEPEHDLVVLSFKEWELHESY